MPLTFLNHKGHKGCRLRGTIKYDSAKLLLTIDLLGTFVFGVEGAMAAIAGNLDLLGLMVLAFATALGGGIIRDLLIGAIPPGLNSRLALSRQLRFLAPPWYFAFTLSSASFLRG